MALPVAKPNGKYNVFSALDVITNNGGKIAKNNPKVIYIPSGNLGLRKLGAVDFLHKFSDYRIIFDR